VYTMPERINPVCDECQKSDPTKWELCTHPCSHLVSWASHQAVLEVISQSRRPIEESSHEVLPCKFCAQEDTWTYTHCQETCTRLARWHHHQR
jgi:hypothetical protein